MDEIGEVLNIWNGKLAALFNQRLQHDDPTIREGAVYFLGEMQAEKSITALTDMLRDEDNKVQNAAVHALSKIGQSALQSLLDILLDDQERLEVRQLSARAIGEIADARAVDPILSLLKTVDEETLMIDLVVALGKIGEKQAVDNLVAIFNDKEASPFLISSSAWSLGRIEDPTTVKHLLKAFHSPIDIVSMSAARALGKIRSKEATEELVHYYISTSKRFHELTSQSKKLQTLKVRALRTIKVIGLPAAKALVNSLEANQNDCSQSVIEDILFALKEISGQDFGNDVKGWLHWVNQRNDDLSI
ncbi:MAG: hypothetical protein GTO18_06380 [Anaerolineales bacterium]|nr:hypothetical protein [Anaerolineales bacterium]